MGTLADEIARIKNELANLGFELMNGITIEEFVKQLVEENNHEART